MTEKKHKLSKGRIIAIVIALLVLVSGGIWFWHQNYEYESTDDAYVEANATQLAPEVSGIVTHVLVDENEKVHAGQILMQIDQKDYRATLASARDDLAALAAQLASAKKDYERSARLVRGHAITRQAYDHARAAYEDLDRRTRASRSKVVQARLNLDYTSLRAPSDGQIARKSVQVGMFAAAGTPLLGFVPYDERWVDANFKETQLQWAVPGRRAKVTVDALSGKTFDGVVESVSPATGATFTLLPPDNATGNFTKVTQRVPVRIHLRNLHREDVELLQAGLSANVDLLKHERLETLPPAAPAIFSTAQIRTPAPPMAGIAAPTIHALTSPDVNDNDSQY